MESLFSLLQNPVVDWLTVFFYIGITALIMWRILKTDPE
jgi:hypothetical protein